MFNCIFCEQETCYYYNLCDKCLKLQSVVKAVGIEKITKSIKLSFKNVDFTEEAERDLPSPECYSSACIAKRTRAKSSC